MAHDKNIMVILSSLRIGKITLPKKFNRNTNHLKFQFHLPQETKIKRSRGVDYYFVSQKRFEDLISEKILLPKFLKIIMARLEKLWMKILSQMT